MVPTGDDQQFRQQAEEAIAALRNRLFEAEEEGGFEVEEHGGVLTVGFEDPSGRFVITANAPVRQIWISALSTSFKLDWVAGAPTPEAAFVLARTGEELVPLVERLIGEHRKTGI